MDFCLKVYNVTIHIYMKNKFEMIYIFNKFSKRVANVTLKKSIFRRLVYESKITADFPKYFLSLTLKLFALQSILKRLIIN